MFNSKMPKAREFKTWIISELLPQLKKDGFYFMKKANKNLLDTMLLEIKNKDNEIQSKENEIKTLKNNMQKVKFGKGGKIYVVKPSNETRDLYKIGYSNDLDNRLPGYNNALPDDIIVIFEITISNVKAVEKCVKSILFKYAYRSDKKEYYECSLKIIKNAIELCNDAINSDPECKQCGSKLLSRFTNANDEYDKDIYVIIFEESPNDELMENATNENFVTSELETESDSESDSEFEISDQIGGNNLVLLEEKCKNLKLKYAKYKYKYLKLKNNV